jgi:mRNA-degrading endonuclease toxin of MazEF toxin-antitoxin module
MGRFYFGQIVGAYVDDGKGNTNERPAIIISDDDDYGITGEILVVPVSKSAQSPCPYYHFQVHDRYDKDPNTGLYFPCWAKCNWARWIQVRRICSTWGHMPDDLLIKIAEMYDTLYNDDTFDNWQ